MTLRGCCHCTTSSSLSRSLSLPIVAALLALAAAHVLAASEATYPARPIRVIVAQAPGGASDLLLRGLAPKLSQRLGQPLVIENRPGAGGNIGAELAAKATADGYSLLMVSAPHAAAGALYRK